MNTRTDIKRKIVDLDHVRNRNIYRNEYFEKIKRCVEDKNRSFRLDAMFCRICFYLDRVQVNSSESSQCGICETVYFCDSYDEYALCKPCAKKHKLCVRCGCDIEYKERREL